MTADVQKVVADVAPVVERTVAAIVSPTVDSILNAGDVAVAAVPPAQAEVIQTVADVVDVSGQAPVAPVVPAPYTGA